MITWMLYVFSQQVHCLLSQCVLDISLEIILKETKIKGEKETTLWNVIVFMQNQYNDFLQRLLVSEMRSYKK